MESAHVPYARRILLKSLLIWTHLENMFQICLVPIEFLGVHYGLLMSSGHLLHLWFVSFDSDQHFQYFTFM